VIALSWSPQSLHDLETIRAYIAEDSPHYADLVLRRLVAAVERLRVFPKSGRIVPERSDPEIREVIVRPYRIVYRVLPGQVEIVTVFHASRLFSDIP
jgi:addiction module RelE/StbE family toxin